MNFGLDLKFFAGKDSPTPKKAKEPSDRNQNDPSWRKHRHAYRSFNGDAYISPRSHITHQDTREKTTEPLQKGTPKATLLRGNQSWQTCKHCPPVSATNIYLLRHLLISGGPAREYVWKPSLLHGFDHELKAASNASKPGEKRSKAAISVWQLNARSVY